MSLKDDTQQNINWTFLLGQRVKPGRSEGERLNRRGRRMDPKARLEPID